MEGESREGCTADCDSGNVVVSPFDYSIENHFRAIDTISELCGVKEDEEASCASEMERVSSRVTFLRQWRDFRYEPRTIRFVHEVGSSQEKDVCNGVNLPQFSAASVPKLERLSSETSCSKERKDFVLYVGGHVWALDWCPSVHQQSDSDIKCEYLAVAAHSPESSYHKIGAALTGRGVIQIWCLLHVSGKEEELPPLTKTKGKGRGRGRPRKKTETEESCGDFDSTNQSVQALVVQLDEKTDKTSPPPKKTRGRPKKKPITEDSLGDLDNDNQFVQAPAVQLNKEMEKTSPPLKKTRGRPRKKMVTEESFDDLDCNDQFVQPLAINLDKETDETSPPLKKIRGRPRKKMVTEESCGDLDNNTQFALALSVQLDRETDLSSLPLMKAKGRPRKQKTVNGSSSDCNKDRRIVPALLDIQGDPIAAPDETGSTKHIHTTSQQIAKAKKGRRRKQKNLNGSSIDCDKDRQIVPSSIASQEDSSAVLGETGSIRYKHEHAALKISDNDVELQTETQEGCDHAVLACKPSLIYTSRKRKMKDKARAGVGNVGIESSDRTSLTESKPNESSSAVLQDSIDCGKHRMTSSPKEVTDGCFETNTPDIQLPNDVVLPKVVLCLAHNGKVAWDVKWRPSNIHDPKDKHCMGYLAVLLGNGSMEVWEVPFPRTIKLLYSSYKEDATDPRFVKLASVFRCSELKFGDRQSMPLTVEWSRSSPYDLILAGCHDGTVALWKFSPSSSCQDTRPLLCFSADNVPIRALAWAPCENDAESANVIATAGHKGLRFWDLRDPYRPLWELNPVNRVIYSLDWLPDPRCVIMSFDDGNLRILSLSKAAYDVPVTGTPYVGTQQQGLHSFPCSSFPIWSVHASRPAGMVAYCSSDGTVVRFQLTRKAVDKDPSRHRASHFLCWSSREEGSTLAVNTPLPHVPLPGVPFPMKKSQNGGFGSDVSKRANDQTSEDTNLALCNGDDPSNFDSPMTPASQKSKTTPKPKAAKKQTPASSLALTIISEEPETSQRGENQEEEKKEFDVFPSKIVAMHRVRWNTNKGSERWLCYGGAAGIVRCQEISIPSIP